MDRDQAEKMSQAADRITEAVEEFTFVIHRFLEYQQELDHRREVHKGYAWPTGRPEPGFETFPGLPEKNAVEFALKASQEVPEEMGRGLDPESKRPAPSPEEVRARREELHKREAEANPDLWSNYRSFWTPTSLQPLRWDVQAPLMIVLSTRSPPEA